MNEVTPSGVSASTENLHAELRAFIASRNLRRMLKFAQTFPDAAIVSTLSTKLSWSPVVDIELKLGHFEAVHKGQMGLYRKWRDRHERQADEEAPIGLILSAESSREQVALLQMHKDGVTVAEYWTELPPKVEFEQQLHAALVEDRERLARRGVLLEGNSNE